MSLTLERHTGQTALDRARNYGGMSEGDLKREAARAVNERDRQTLWDMTEAFIILNGKAGAKLSRHTVRAYRRGVFDVLKAFEGENLLRPSRDAGRLWVRGMEGDGLKPSTVTLKLAAARQLYKMLRWAEVTEANPLENITPAADRVNAWVKRQPYPEADVHKLLSAGSASERSLVLLGAHAGLRASEMTALRWQDVDLEAAELVVLLGKGRKTRRVPLSPALVGALSDLKTARGVRDDSRRVFPVTEKTLRERMQRLCDLASVSYLGLHSLRHTAGTMMQREVGDLNYTAEFLGHASIETTRGYAKRSDDTLKRVVSGWGAA